MQGKFNISVFILSVCLVTLCAFGTISCRKTDDITPADTTFTRLLTKQVLRSDILNGNINYEVFLPENYNNSTDSFPVVYLLHGFGDNETSWYSGGRLFYYTSIYASEIVPIIYVMPQGFNSYYVNRYNGKYKYMDMFVQELVPEIDSLFRTKADKSQRAVMGYSMGGYGALILPAMNPDVFSISVPLSMSFRTDEQYMAEPDGVFDYQWGPIFGGIGTTGTARLTDYFKQYSPFYFFKEGDLSRFDKLKILIDCGDDEESLSVTNNTLHCVMRDNNIKHEYRVSNGAHSWDYWHNSLHEALVYISTAFLGKDYPEVPALIDVGPALLAENTKLLTLTDMGIDAGILIPPDYDSVAGNYPVIYLIHDFSLGKREEERNDLFTLIYNSMLASKLPKSIVVEIPAESSILTKAGMHQIVSRISSEYACREDNKSRILIGNGNGGGIANQLVQEDTLFYGSCYLFNAILPEGVKANGGSAFYYLEGSDESAGYSEYNSLYLDLRDKGKKFEYRIQQGDDSFPSFLKGFADSFGILKKTLTN
ncbi:MAG: hypothetical protein H6538_00835 [Bacteroidales bacterium]|nr:hypothetical protein [Bacteroidales bacterium]MCB8999962.1 hypothetical protein [Bacteroidales bacterium]MCB9012587.1 hypothetical protein [Bacteroidales bacterium]